MKQALIIYGGWEGHVPKETSQFYQTLLESEGYQVTLASDFEPLYHKEELKRLDLLIMNWTRGELPDEPLQNVTQAVAEGLGLAGVHGGFASAFQASKGWLFLTGGCFLAHPGGLETTYSIDLTTDHYITANTQSIPQLTTEQYYCLVDPAVTVLATSIFAAKDHPNAANQEVILPMMWIKKWGKGRVFFQSIGHSLKELEEPTIQTWTKRGFLWATRNTLADPLKNSQYSE
ncbi:ThuA domain-containing protein [Enterococcus casseliflavus]|uniref:ThuA domain-containing protein n=1 Tax=Enterococcus casseliflavus TaxID=37734 RepID=UPI003D0E4876